MFHKTQNLYCYELLLYILDCFVSPFPLVITAMTENLHFRLQGQNISLEWPGWCKFLAAFLILTAVMWIPGVAVLKYWNIVPWRREEPAYIPKHELQVQPGSTTDVTSSTWRTKLFYWMPKVTITNEISSQNLDQESLSNS